MQSNNKSTKGLSTFLDLAVGMLVLLGPIFLGSTPIAEASPVSLEARRVENALALLQDVGSLNEVPPSDRPQARRGDPVFSWNLAARLQQQLSDEQKEQLIESVNRPVRGPIRGRLQESRQGLADSRSIGRSTDGRQERPQRGPRPGPRASGPPQLDLPRLDLSPAQQKQLRTAREAQRREFDALRNEFDQGTISEEDFERKMEELYSSLIADMAEFLSKDQHKILAKFDAERIARRERVRAENDLRRSTINAAMAEALQLTAAQTDELKTLVEQHQRDRNSILRGAPDSNQESSLESRLSELRTSHVEALRETLDEEQLETFQIHAALMRRNGARSFQDSSACMRFVRNSSLRTGRGFRSPRFGPKGRSVWARAASRSRFNPSRPGFYPISYRPRFR